MAKRHGHCVTAEKKDAPRLATRSVAQSIDYYSRLWPRPGPSAWAPFSSLSSAQSFFLQYFVVAGRTGKFCLREQNARSSRRATEDADVERAAAGLR